MAWTAPMTAVANAVFTAAQFNVHVRDNLLETAPAKATTAGSIFVGNGTNDIAERIPSHAYVDTGQSTTSTSFTDLTTVGPAVTVTTGTKAIVTITSNMSNAAGGATFSVASAAVSGASTIAAAHSPFSISNNQTAFTNGSRTAIFTGLTAGSNTFTMKYATTNGANAATFEKRGITVIPL